MTNRMWHRDYVQADGGVLVALVYGHPQDEQSRAMAAKMTFTLTARKRSSRSPTTTLTSWLTLDPSYHKLHFSFRVSATGDVFFGGKNLASGGCLIRLKNTALQRHENGAPSGI